MLSAVPRSVAETKDIVVIENFAAPDMSWYPVIDTFVAGNSTGAVLLEDGLGKLEGEVRTFSSTNAPGFVGMQAQDDFPDVSTCEGLAVVGRSTTPDYTFEISFGTAHTDVMRYGRGYKSPLKFGDQMEEVRISFVDFSDNWNEFTGKLNVKCEENNEYCPTTKTLRNMAILGFWAEGKIGPVNLQIKSVKAYDCVTNNDGDLFKSLTNMFNSPNEAESGPSSSLSRSDVLSIVALSLGALALVVSLVAVRGVKRSAQATPKPEMKASDPDANIL